MMNLAARWGGSRQESAEDLIRRIMKRAEKEQAEIVKAKAKEKEERRRAQLEALGVLDVEGAQEGVAGVDIDEDLDLALEENPWNTRDFGSRTEILHRTLYRSFAR